MRYVAVVGEIDPRGSAVTEDISNTDATRTGADVEISRDDGGGLENRVEAGASLENGDLEDTVLSDADRKLDAIYGDYVHQNPGQNLHAGIADDEVWQGYWRRLITYPSDRKSTR